MTATEKLAHKRLTLLQLAEKLGNISKACRMHKVSRSQFYEYKRAFQEHGLEGLVDRPPVPGSHPSQLPKETTDRIIALSLAHPAFGQQRIADQLALEGISVCPTSVRNVWIKEGLETKYKRLLRLEEKAMAKGFKLTEQQIKLLEKANPEFAERHVKSDYPGYLLCQDTFYVGRLKGVGRIYLQAVVDTFGSLAFGKLYTSKRQETAADVLYDRVLPFYERHGLAIQAILTDNGTEYKGRPTIHLYEIFLELNDIEHRTTKVATPRTNGFVERFNRTVLDEFFRTAFRKRLYESVEALQTDLDAWLHHYNHERPHRGYRNKGRRPMETFESGKIRRKEMLKEAA
ncbi:MAG: IS481 family transposase [Anaerolineae bacterium]|jgi:transposase InsO family protein|nr:IS481 family transposase [Anaerolineae bacterium]